MFALEAKGVAKSYGGVTALKGVDFAVRPGSVHALLGENGAGKSTLMKIMTGAVRPDRGSLLLDGRPVRFRSTAEAARGGVAVVAQELSLFPHLDILDNLFPMREPRLGPFVLRRRMRDLALPVMAELGIERPLDTPVADLTLAERQLVEIAKALISRPKVLLLDEPTSALEAGASARLIKLIGILRDRNVGVVFVSHILEQVMALCDEVTILRDGAAIMAQQSLSSLTLPDLVGAMLGDKARRAPRASSAARAPGTPCLTVEGVSSDQGLQEVSFTVAKGEVVGLAGLAGSGPEAMLAAIAGLSPISKGRITLPGGADRPASLRAAIDRGVAFVSGDRRKLGLMLDKPIWENIVQVRSVGMARDGAILSTKGLRRRAADLAGLVGVKTPTVDAHAGSLSGGNQQKVVLAKWLDMGPEVLLLDDPTRGVDVGAREDINGILRRAAGDGAVVIYLSTDLEELVAGCDRVLVFHRGRVCAQLAGEQLSAARLSQVMNTGVPGKADQGRTVTMNPAEIAPG
jgi:ABC-type sugar transport system ATPase subunit